jgi:hypothetical protein
MMSWYYIDATLDSKFVFLTKSIGKTMPRHTTVDSSRFGEFAELNYAAVEHV